MYKLLLLVFVFYCFVERRRLLE